MYRVFDIHTHAFPETVSAKAAKNLGAFYQMNIYGKGTISELTDDMVASGYDGFLCLAVATNAHQVKGVNEGMAKMTEYAQQRGLICRGFGGVHQDCEDIAAEVDRIESLGLCGIKIHPDIQGVDIDDKRLLPLYEAAEGRMPVYFHMGDDRPQYQYSKADKLIKIMKMFPKLRIGAAHFGSYGVWEDSRKLAGLENIWFDTSSSLHKLPYDRAVEIIRSLGAEKFMFGSDYPIILPSTAMSYFMKLDLTEDERKMILFDNAMRFLGIPEKEYTK